MAARRLADGERLLRIDAAEDVEGYEVHSRAPDRAPERSVLTDPAPGLFVSRLAGESGEVRVAPLVWLLLQRLRDARKRS